MEIQKEEIIIEEEEIEDEDYMKVCQTYIIFKCEKTIIITMYTTPSFFHMVYIPKNIMYHMVRFNK